MIGHIICDNSVFLNEGKNNLIEEFGKDYGTYFSILSSIARGKNTRNRNLYMRRDFSQIV